MYQKCWLTVRSSCGWPTSCHKYRALVTSCSVPNNMADGKAIMEVLVTHLITDMGQHTNRSVACPTQWDSLPNLDLCCHVSPSLSNVTQPTMYITLQNTYRYLKKHPGTDHPKTRNNVKKKQKSTMSMPKRECLSWRPKMKKWSRADNKFKVYQYLIVK